ncbi:MAG: glycosyltransferase family 9 protein [Bacteroidetes bacterium]|nr:glycosyltransferase family 9 protein [Bacteroidota bacterium]
MVVKFLIIRFSSIGDIILTTPVIRNLKNQIEGAEIHYLTKKAYLPVLEDNPFIHKIHLFDNNYSQLLKELKALEIDFIIDLHNNLRSSRFKLTLKRVSFSFNKLNTEKWLMVNFKLNRLPNVHIVDRYMETLDMFSVKNDKAGLDFFVNSENELDIKSLPEIFHKGYMAVVIGARHNTKQLPDEKIILLLQKLHYPVILLGGKEDEERGNTITAQIGESCLNLSGKLSIQQSASIVKQSQLVISHDTGLMHIAAAFKKTILSVWGNTIPEFGMTPYLAGEDSEIYGITGLSCRPCSKIGFDKCPLKHFKCMNQIDLDAIASKAHKILGI